MILIMIRVIVLYGVVEDLVHLYQVILLVYTILLQRHEKFPNYNLENVLITFLNLFFQEVKADQIAEDLHLKSMSHHLQTLISPSLQC